MIYEAVFKYKWVEITVNGKLDSCRLWDDVSITCCGRPVSSALYDILFDKAIDELSKELYGGYYD